MQAAPRASTTNAAAAAARRRKAAARKKLSDAQYAKQLAEQEALDLLRAEEQDFLLAQKLAQEEEEDVVEEEDADLATLRILQLQSDEDLAMEIQTQTDDVAFARALQRELGPQTYSARVAASSSTTPACNSRQTRAQEEDAAVHVPKYTIDCLMQCIYSHGGGRGAVGNTSQATLARLRELQAKDVRYNLAYLPEIQQTKQRLALERREEADALFLKMNPQVVQALTNNDGEHLPTLQVDLHLMTVQQAEERVTALLEYLVLRRKPICKICLITGKGSNAPSKLMPAMLALCERRRDLVRNVIRGEGKLDLTLVRLM